MATQFTDQQIADFLAQNYQNPDAIKTALAANPDITFDRIVAGAKLAFPGVTSENVSSALSSIGVRQEFLGKSSEPLPPMPLGAPPGGTPWAYANAPAVNPYQGVTTPTGTPTGTTPTGTSTAPDLNALWKEWQAVPLDKLQEYWGAINNDQKIDPENPGMLARAKDAYLANIWAPQHGFNLSQSPGNVNVAGIWSPPSKLWGEGKWMSGGPFGGSVYVSQNPKDAALFDNNGNILPTANPALIKNYQDLSAQASANQPGFFSNLGTVLKGFMTDTGGIGPLLTGTVLTAAELNPLSNLLGGGTPSLTDADPGGMVGPDGTVVPGTTPGGATLPDLQNLPSTYTPGPVNTTGPVGDPFSPPPPGDFLPDAPPPGTSPPQTSTPPPDFWTPTPPPPVTPPGTPTTPPPPPGPDEPPNLPPAEPPGTPTTPPSTPPTVPGTPPTFPKIPTVPTLPTTPTTPTKPGLTLPGILTGLPPILAAGSTLLNKGSSVTATPPQFTGVPGIGGPQSDIGRSLIDQFKTGKLDAAQQFAIDQFQKGQTAKARDFYSKAGIPDSTMERGTEADIEARAVAMRQQALDDNLKIGLNALNATDQEQLALYGDQLEALLIESQQSGIAAQQAAQFMQAYAAFIKQFFGTTPSVTTPTVPGTPVPGLPPPEQPPAPVEEPPPTPPPEETPVPIEVDPEVVTGP